MVGAAVGVAVGVLQVWDITSFVNVAMLDQKKNITELHQVDPVASKQSVTTPRA